MGLVKGGTAWYARNKKEEPSIRIKLFCIEAEVLVSGGALIVPRKRLICNILASALLLNSVKVNDGTD